jgi:hypothetical protein
MSTRAVAAATELAVNTDTYISSAQTFVTNVTLPKVNDGTGSSVAVGKHIRVESTTGAPINVLTNSGRLILTVPGRRSVVLVAKSGTVQNEPDSWEAFVQTQTPAAFVAAAPAGGVGAAAGAYDTAGNRDSMIALVNAMRTVLVNAGLMKAE